MSRAVPLDHAFDKVKFAELLKRAQGDRQQNTFADDIGMSKTYLNSKHYFELKPIKKQ